MKVVEIIDEPLPPGPHEMHVLDRVQRLDCILGTVQAVTTLRVLVAWDDGAVTEVEQFDRACYVLSRGRLPAADDRRLDELRAELVAKEEERSDLQTQVDELEDQIDELDDEISVLEEAVEELEISGEAAVAAGFWP